MWQTILVALIVAVAILYLLRMIFRKATRQESPCAGCGGCTPTPYDGSRTLKPLEQNKAECVDASRACSGSDNK